jgi:hypothetical protein|tara:strand:- start:739 stop:993 length:255 start_codon:yes stop_codon:yes gene_type:complete
MNEMMIEIISGLGVLASGFFYTKFQTTQNHKEIDTLKTKLHENEKLDAIRDTKLAVMESQSNAVITRLDKMDIILEKIFEKINK